MVLNFFDTSALVKLYHDEKGTDKVDEIIDGEGEIVITSIFSC